MRTTPRVLWSAAAGDRVELATLTTLAEAGVIAHVVAEPESPVSHRCQDLGLAVSEHRFQGRIDQKGIRLIRTILEETEPNIYHALTNRTLSNGLLAARHRELKVVAYRGTCGHLHRWDPASRMSYLNPRVDRIVCVSDAVREYLRSMKVPDKRLCVIHKGHDPNWYASKEPPARKELGLSEEDLVIGFVGNIRPVKGVDVLIEAVRRLPADLPVRLLLVGEIRDRGIAKAVAAPAVRNRIRAVGFRADAASLFPLMDISVMPSVDREGLPRAILESMAHGTPCIGTRVGGIPELIEEGVSGRLVPPKDPAALAEAIEQLCTQPEERSRLAEGGRERLAGPFHIRHTIAKTQALYESVLDPPSPIT